jgi:outer membrane biosynthesis protein TonB
MKTYAINAVLSHRTRIHLSRLMQLPLLVLMVAIACTPNTEAANRLNAPAGDSIHQVVDKQPAFKGKPSDIKKFINKNLVYPDNAWVEGVEGIVEVSFVITSNGSLMNAKIVSSV